MAKSQTASGRPREHWNVFDARCVVGRRLHLHEGELHTVDDLLAEMDHFGIAEALVVDSLARENHPLDGNRRLLECIAGHERLHGAYVVLPHGPADEQPQARDLIRDMRKHRVGAAVLLPNHYRFTLADWCVDELLEPLEAAKVPVFIDVAAGAVGPYGADQTDWNQVVALCRRRPKLPVIVCETRIRTSQRTIYRALDACPNLRIETSAYFLHRGIEYVVRHWGSGRLVYGSNWPAWGQGMSAMLTCAEIGDRDKLNIAGDNLRRLLAWCKTPRPRVSLPAPADELERFGRSGRPPKDLRVVDCHGHLGGQARDYHLPDSTLEATLHEMDRLCVRKVCVFSFAGVWSDEVHGNNIIIDAVKRYPDRFVGFTMVNPHRGEKAMLQELGRCQKLGLRGVKLIGDYQGYPGDGPLIDVACKWAHEHRQIVLNHEWASPQQIERLAAKYPNACFLFGHAYNAFAEPVTRRKNVYVCSCPLWRVDDTEKWVRAIGPDRLLFGSDLQDLPVAWGLGPILFARIPAEQKRMILGGNLDRILQRYSRPSDLRVMSAT